MNFLKQVIKRAITREGGGYITLRNEAGDVDTVALAALGARIVLIAAALAVANHFGIGLETILSLIGWSV
jgi:hypothetical protein